MSELCDEGAPGAVLSAGGDMSDAGQPPEESAPATKPAHVVRLPGFVRDEPIGLGTVVKRATNVLGIGPCSGCEQRAARLDRFVGFGGRER